MKISDQKYDLSAYKYNYLYKRYLQRSPMDILHMFDIYNLKDRVIWDLCCGANMRATKDFLIDGAKFVYSIDNYEFDRKLRVIENGTILAEKLFKGKFHLVYNDGISQFLEDFQHFRKRDAIVKPSLIFCQQGMSYIFNINLIKDLLQCLSCPTENKPYGPSNIIFNMPKYSQEKREEMERSSLTKVYEIDGERYIEVSWIRGSHFIDGKDVPILYHMQWCESLGSHNTAFFYFNHEDICESFDQNRIRFEMKEDENTVFFKI